MLCIDDSSSLMNDPWFWVVYFLYSRIKIENSRDKQSLKMSKILWMDANCQKSQKYFSFWIIPAEMENGFLEMVKDWTKHYCRILLRYFPAVFSELCHQTIPVSQLRKLNMKLRWPLKTAQKHPIKILQCKTDIVPCECIIPILVELSNESGTKQPRVATIWRSPWMKDLKI